VYFYQLGMKLGLSRLVAGGVKLGFKSKSGIDLPEEKMSQFPDRVPEYFVQKYGPRGLDASIGRVEPVDWSGRKLADGFEHGAILFRGRHGRSGGYAARRGLKNRK
jgi:hypothetical protein